VSVYAYRDAESGAVTILGEVDTTAAGAPCLGIEFTEDPTVATQWLDDLHGGRVPRDVPKASMLPSGGEMPVALGP
jgi:hypothetical protein